MNQADLDAFVEEARRIGYLESIAAIRRSPALHRLRALGVGTRGDAVGVAARAASSCDRHVRRFS